MSRLEYKKRVFSIQESYESIRRYSYDSGPPSGFARQAMIEFARHEASAWFIENRIAVSVETYQDAMTMSYRADLIAHMTPVQVDAWEKQEFIRKLST